MMPDPADATRSPAGTPPILGFGAALAHIDDQREVARLLMEALPSVVPAHLRAVVLMDDGSVVGRLGTAEFDADLRERLRTRVCEASGVIPAHHPWDVTPEAWPALAEAGLRRVDQVRIGTVERHFGVMFAAPHGDAQYAPADVASLQLLAAQAALALHRIQADEERAAKARALKEREERYRHLAEAVFEGVVLTDEGTIIDLNQQFAEMMGYSREALIDTDVLQFVVPEERGQAAEYIQSGYENTYESVCVRKDGTTFPVEVRGRMMAHRGRSVRVTAVRDITRQKQTQRALRRTRDRLEERVEERTAELAEANETLRVQAKRLEILQDIDRAILAAQSPQEIAGAVLQRIPQLMPCTRASVALFDWEADAGEVLAMYQEGESQLDQGVTVPISEFRVTERLQAGKAEVVNDIEAVRQTEIIQEIARQGVRSYMSLPMFIEDELIGLVNMGATQKRAYTPEHQENAREVADQLAVSIRQARLMEQVRQQREELEERVQERTAELEAFTYSVSHDLRSPLRAIDGFTRMLREQYSDDLDAEGQRLLNIVCSSTKKMGQLIDGLLTLSRIGRREMRHTPIDMESLARDVAEELMRADDPGDVTLTVEALPRAEGDRSMLRQVLTNLLSNALKFTQQEEDPRITVGARDDDGRTVYFVRDNGAGFDMEYADKLFGVFQRLHEEDEFEGTGVGLAIVERIIRRHGGEVWAEGAEGEGATFFFTL